MKTKNSAAAKVRSPAGLCHPIICLTYLMSHISPNLGRATSLVKGDEFPNIKAIPCHVEILRGAALE